MTVKNGKVLLDARVPVPFPFMDVNEAIDLASETPDAAIIKVRFKTMRLSALNCKE